MRCFSDYYKIICLYDFCLENKEHVQDLSGSTVGELQDLIAEDNNELDFKIPAYELLHRNNLYWKRDHTIDWDALTEDIIDAITEVEDAVYQESDGEEEALPTTTIKNLHEALASLQNLKGYIESTDVEVMIAILRFWTFQEREVLISREHAPQKKAVDFLDSHSVNTPLFIGGGS